VNARATDRLFVYGSLRSDAPRGQPFAQVAFALLEAGATLEGRGSVGGRIYAPSWYPALVPGAPGQVMGEVWRLLDPEILAALDAYEGEAYVRERIPALMRDGPTVTAWAYCYQADLKGVPEIASGDYLDWVRQRP
jgi:gamma-glutamylcyclotransferase (GGCT)/AIG2-like uncharacterized protein YtfP